MKESEKVLVIDCYEQGILINALNEFRNELIRQKQETEPVDEVMLKTIDAPDKRKVLFHKRPKRLMLDEAR